MRNNQRGWHILFLVLLTFLVERSLADDGRSFAKPIQKSIQKAIVNPQLMDLTVPVLRSGRFLGEVGIRVNENGSGLMVKATHLITLLNDDLAADAKKSLNALPAGKYLSVAEAKALGLNMRFDMASTSVFASITGQASAQRSLPLSLGSSSQLPNNGREPTGLSGYLNIFASSSGSDFNGDYKFSDLSYSFESALHVAPLAHMSLETFGSMGVDGKFNRGDIRGVWHSIDRENNWRLRVGDVSASGISYMNGLRLQGAEFTNSDTRRRNRAGVGNVGNNEFFLERPAIAKLLVNGSEVKRYNLEPGPYNVKDFPLANGANDVAFVIQDERGEVERIEFNAFADTSLVGRGEYSYSFSVGRGLSDTGNYQYEDSRGLLSGFLETGVTPSLSLGAGLQLAEKARLGAVTAKLGTPVGRFDFQAGAVLRDEGQNGQAAKLSWRDNRSNTTKQRRRPSLGFSAAYQSEYFDGVFDDASFNEEKLRLDVFYSQEFPRGFSGGISSNYTQNRTTSDSYRHTFRLGKSLERLKIGSSISYLDGGVDSGWEGRLTIGYDFEVGKLTKVSGRYEHDTNDGNTTELSLSSNYQKGLRLGNGVLDYKLGLSADKNGDGSVNGGVNYTGNRFEFSASHSTDIDSLTDSSLDGQQTTLRAGAALAFAEGKFAIGRPVNNNFAIFHPHSSIAGKQLLVGSRNEQGVYHVQSDGFGPLLADLGGRSFQARNMQYDVNDLPLGYDLGTGFTSLAPRYKSGLAVEVGSAYNVIVIAQLLDGFDRPLKLLLGKATEVGAKNPRSADAFTDSKGMLSASGLAPGRWKVEMFAKKPITYMLNVPRGKTGIVELGKLKPTSQNQ